MADDDRYEYGYDNRIIILKSLLERHLKDTHNPHQVSWADLIGSEEVDKRIDASVYSIEAKFNEDLQFCLYLYDYNGELIGEPIPIAVGTASDWASLVGDPTDNVDLRKYLYRIDLKSDGIGYTYIPEFNNTEYGFKSTYDLEELDFENNDILYDDPVNKITITTYKNYQGFGKGIAFKNNTTTYYYFNYNGNTAWYIYTTGYTEYTGSLTFDLEKDFIGLDKETLLSKIINPVVEGE